MEIDWKACTEDGNSRIGHIYDGAYLWETVCNGDGKPEYGHRLPGALFTTGHFKITFNPAAPEDAAFELSRADFITPNYKKWCPVASFEFETTAINRAAHLLSGAATIPGVN